MKRKTPPVSRAVTFWKVLNLIFIEIAGEIHTDTHSHSSDLFSQDKCASVVAFFTAVGFPFAGMSATHFW